MTAGTFSIVAAIFGAGVILGAGLEVGRQVAAIVLSGFRGRS